MGNPRFQLLAAAAVLTPRSIESVRRVISLAAYPKMCDTQSGFFGIASQTEDDRTIRDPIILRRRRRSIVKVRTRFSCEELIILPLLSTLVNHTKTILVQNLVFCMIPRDSGMQCSGFVIPLMCRILNRGFGYGTTSGCTRRWPPQWKSSAQHWPMERPSAVTLLSISHRKPHFFPHSTPHSALLLCFRTSPNAKKKALGCV